MQGVVVGGDEVPSCSWKALRFIHSENRREKTERSRVVSLRCWQVQSGQWYFCIQSLITHLVTLNKLHCSILLAPYCIVLEQISTGNIHTYVSLIHLHKTSLKVRAQIYCVHYYIKQVVDPSSPYTPNAKCTTHATTRGLPLLRCNGEDQDQVSQV